MYDKILKKMRRAARAGRMIFVDHAFDELGNQDFSEADALNAIMTGEIIEDQFDENYGDIKYQLYGDSRDGRELALIIKSDRYGNVVIITAWWVKYSDYE